MTSDRTFPKRFTRIDDLTRADHYYLNDKDTCYFIGEYTARQGFNYSTTNNLILNFKKAMNRRDKPEWTYKEQAIKQAAMAFRIALGNTLDQLTFVPIPPSKTKGDPLYDDRLKQMLCAIQPNTGLDIRELIVQTSSTEAVHSSVVRPKLSELGKLYRIDEALIGPKPKTIAIIDDILTTGAHFRAIESLLSTRFPASQIIGLFLARRVPNTSDFEELE